MSDKDITSATPFPRGIADAEGRFAALADRAGRVVAVALDDGTLLWRSAEPLRPLLIAAGELVTLREGEPAACVAFALEGPRAGKECWRSEALELPEWAVGPGAQLEAAARLHDDTIELAWQARARYGGGAAPGPGVAKKAAHDAQGAMAIERPGGAVRPLDVPAAEILESTSTLPPPADAEPDVLGEQRLGERVYRLAVEQAPGSVRTVLRAHDASGAPLWETVVDEGPPRAPRALRK